MHPTAAEHTLPTAVRIRTTIKLVPTAVPLPSAAGAYGCTISGAGPTAVAVVPDPETGAKVAEAMCNAFRSTGGLEVNSSKVLRLDPEGAKFV